MRLGFVSRLNAATLGLLLVGTSFFSQTKGGNKAAEIHYLRGLYFLDKGKNQEAIVELRASLELKPSQADARYQLGLANWKLGNMPAAGRNFRRALELAPDHALSAYYLGKIALQNKDTLKGIEYLKKVVQLGNGKPVQDEYFQLGKAYLTEAKINEAIAVLEKGATVQPRDDRIFALLGKAYLSSGRRTDAEKALDRSKEVRDYVREATTLLLQCSQYLKSHEIDKATEIYNRLSDTVDVNDLVSLGIDFGESELFDQAIKVLERAVQLSPDLYEAHYNLGLMYFRTQREKEAEEHLTRAAALHPYSFEASSLSGVILSQVGKTDEAIQVLQRAHALKSDDLKVVTLLSLQLIEGRYYTEAVKTLDSALKQWPGNLDLNLLLIQTYHRDRKYEKAVQAAGQTVAQYPASARANYEMGYQLMNFGRIKDSKFFLEKTIQLDPDFAEGYFSLGDLQAKEGNHELATNYFRKALEKDPGHVESSLGLAKSLLSLKRYPEVVIEMEKVIKIEPANPQPHFHLSQAFLGMGEKQRAEQESQIFKQLNEQRMIIRDQEAGRTYEVK